MLALLPFGTNSVEYLIFGVILKKLSKEIITVIADLSLSHKKISNIVINKKQKCN